MQKLADFGLATTFRKGDVARTMLGTPGYIAPYVTSISSYFRKFFPFFKLLSCFGRF